MATTEIIRAEINRIEISKTSIESSIPSVRINGSNVVSSGGFISQATDTTSNGNNFTEATNQPKETYDSKLERNVIDFTASDSIELSCVKSIPLNKGDFTLFALVKVKDLGRGIILGDFGRPNAFGINFELYTVTPASLRLYFANNPNLVGPTNEFVADQWFVYVAKRKGSDFSVLNESNNPTTITDTTPATPADNASQNFGLGRDSRDLSALNGYIDEMVIYPRALEGAEFLDRLVDFIELGKIVPTDYIFAIDPDKPETITPNSDSVYEGVEIEEIEDLSGNDYNPAEVSGKGLPTWEVLNGKGLILFDGSTDRLAHTLTTPIQGASTISIVYKSDAVHGDADAIFSSDHSAGNDSFQIHYNSSNLLEFRLTSSTGVDTRYPIESVANTDIHEVIITTDGIDNVTIYFDGVFISSNTVATGFNCLYEAFKFGTNRLGTTAFNGYVGECRVYDRVLNVAERGALSTTLKQKYNIA
jgi:hypothetical protein